MSEKECCVDCGAYTNRAGKGDGSLYSEDGRGPLCLPCYDHRRIGELKTSCASLHARIAELEEAAKDILANGYDTGRRIRLRAALSGVK